MLLFWVIAVSSRQKPEFLEAWRPRTVPFTRYLHKLNVRDLQGIPYLAAGPLWR